MVRGGKKSNLTNMCIYSWKEKLPDYEIIEWNESNLPLKEIAEKNLFFRECMKRNLYAFMADYLRLYVLYHFGGIYFDTDVQVLKSFDPLLDTDAFIGYEAYGKYFGSGVIAASPKHPMLKHMLDFYDADIWNVDFYTIPMALNYVFGMHPEALEAVKIYPKEFFAPYDYHKEFDFSMIYPETYSIHWFDGSWKDNLQVGVFMGTKHIKNPVVKNIAKIKKYLAYYCRKIVS